MLTLTHASGSTADVFVGFGFNCYRLRLVAGEKSADVLYAHPNFTSGQERPSGSGVPILFPFPGRIPGGKFSWDGVDYTLPATDGRGNAIHGFVHHRRWRLLEQSETRAVGQFQASVDDASILKQWPADFRITATYTLEADALTMAYLVENPDDKPLPCGLGTHPYYKLPIGGPSADECLISLPVRRQWELVELLPTGRQIALPAGTECDKPAAFGPLQFDSVFTDLSRGADGWSKASVTDPAAGLTLTARFSGEFRECVVYTPPHRQAICIEPLTCVPGAIGLHSQGVEAGLKILAPGDSFRATVRFELQQS